jgi:hypothetical protein
MRFHHCGMAPGDDLSYLIPAMRASAKLFFIDTLIYLKWSPASPAGFVGI